uniref:hypothetical protein n=1 Tax=uncultured Eubacterium sp. TaxID=165185 RepID=UPI0025FB62EE
MKKIVSLIMSIVMLLSVLSSVNLSALASDESSSKQIKSATFVSSTVCEIYEGAYGGYDETTGKGYYWAPLYYSQGDAINIEFSDGTTDTYIYEDVGFCNSDYSYLNLSYYSFYFDGLGETTAYVSLEDYNYDLAIPVKIIENPVKSFSVIPSSKYEIMEKTNGFDDDGEWRYNSPYFKEGDKISVNYSNGTSKVYGISGSDSSTFYIYDDEVGKDIYVLDRNNFSFNGTGETSFTVNLYEYNQPNGNNKLLATASVPITIIENPIASISLSPIKPYKIMEKTNGYYEDESDNFVYFGPDFNEGDKLTVNYKDNTTKTYVYEENDDRSGFFNNDECLRAYFESNEKVTGLGKTIFKMTVDEYNVSTDVEVEIVENPIASFELKPVKPYELYDKQGNPYFKDFLWFYNPKFNNGDVITVNYKDGTTVDYTYSSSQYKFIDANSNILHVNEQSGLAFEVEKNNLSDAKFEITLNDYNKSIQYPVTIVESPVESVTLSPVKPYEIVEWTHGYFDSGDDWFYYPPYNEGDIVTVTYKTGKKVVYKFNGENFVDENNEILEIEDETNFFHGVGDATFYLTLAKYGNKAEYTVKIVSASPHTHIWSDWHYNNDAVYNSSTDYTDGTATRTCSECGESETKTIEGTGLLRANSASVVLDASV